MNTHNTIFIDDMAKILFADEEIGGFLGMNLFVKTEDFKKMNVGFALDEGKFLLSF